MGAFCVALYGTGTGAMGAVNPDANGIGSLAVRPSGFILFPGRAIVCAAQALESRCRFGRARLGSLVIFEYHAPVQYRVGCNPVVAAVCGGRCDFLAGEPAAGNASGPLAGGFFSGLVGTANGSLFFLPQPTGGCRNRQPYCGGTLGFRGDADG